MKLDDFLDIIKATESDEGLLDLCRKQILHGTPFIFQNKDEEFYEFRKRIGLKFNIPFYEIYITGSAKLGFSPKKEKVFDYDSDVDVAIVSPSLYEEIMMNISDYQMQVRKNRKTITIKEMEMYHSFLEYVALGWIRPDKLPISFQMNSIKDDWFGFFSSISNGKSEVGNYKVAAGIFKSYTHLERYTYSGIYDLKHRKELR
jgi:hypothetical protein